MNQTNTGSRARPTSSSDWQAYGCGCDAGCEALAFPSRRAFWYGLTSRVDLQLVVERGVRQQVGDVEDDPVAHDAHTGMDPIGENANLAARGRTLDTVFLYSPREQVSPDRDTLRHQRSRALWLHVASHKPALARAACMRPATDHHRGRAGASIPFDERHDTASASISS